MKRDSVTYRLGTSGEGDVLQTLAKIGEAGDTSARRLGKAWERDSRVAEAALQRVERSAERLKVLGGSSTQRNIAESTGLAQSELGNTKSAEASMRAFVQAQDELANSRQRLLMQHDPLFAAQQRYNSVMAEAVRLDRQGALQAGELGRIHASAKANLDSYSGAMATVGQANNAMRAGTQQLGFQVSDFAVQMAGGTSAIRAFSMQGPQAVQALALMGGGADNAQGKFGKFANFLAGPWGAAILVATSIAGALATKLLDTEKASDKASDANATLADKLDMTKRSIEEVTAATKEYNDQAERAGKTALQQAEAASIEARENFKAAMAIRERLQATYDLYQQQVRAGPTGPGGQGQAAAAYVASEVSDLIAQNDARIAEFEQALTNTEFDFAKEWARIQSDPVAKVTERFEQMREQLRGSGLEVDDLKRKMADLARQEEAAKNKIRDRGGSSGAGASNRASSVGDMTALLKELYPDARITSTTGGKHTKGSDHYKGRAIDFVIPGMMNSQGTQQVYEMLREAGIDIRRNARGTEQFFGPGRHASKRGDHDDHFHVAWDGKAPDAYKMREQAEKDLQEQMERNTDAVRALIEAGDPYAAIANRMNDELAEIDRLAAAGPAQGGIGSEQADILRSQARDRATYAKGDLFNQQNPGYLEAIEEADRLYAEQQKAVRGMAEDQARSNAFLAIEEQTLRATSAERDRQIALLEYKLYLEDSGVDIASAEAQELMRGNQALYDRTEALRRSQQILDEQRRIGEQIIDELFDPGNWDDWGEMGKRIIQMLIQEMLVLAAINPLKNQLFGSNLPTIGGGGIIGFLGGILGGTPAPENLLAGTPFGNAAGTEYSDGGWRRVGEFGEELVRLPRGAQVMNAGKTRSMSAPAAPSVTTISINADGADSAQLQRVEEAVNRLSATLEQRAVAAAVRANRDSHGMIFAA